MNLQPIVPHVVAHVQATAPTSNVRKGLQKIEYCGIAMGVSGAALMIGTGLFAFFALAFLGSEAQRMSPTGSKIFAVGLLLLLKGAFIFAVPWIIKEFFPRHPRPASLSDPDKTKELSPEAQPLASITEQTTRNLELTLSAPQNVRQRVTK